MEHTNAVIVVGGVIEKDGKFLLVQEAKAKCFGKWNLPAGHLEIGEDIFEGAKREIKEETGCDTELTGICQIGSRRRKDLAFVAILFSAKLLRETIHINNQQEILDIKWFSYEEILAMKDDIRNVDLMLGTIDNYRKGIIAPLEVVKLYQNGTEFQNVTIHEENP